MQREVVVISDEDDEKHLVTAAVMEVVEGKNECSTSTVRRVNNQLQLNKQLKLSFLDPDLGWDAGYDTDRRLTRRSSVEVRPCATAWKNDHIMVGNIAGAVKIGPHFVGVAATSAASAITIHTADFLREPGDVTATPAEKTGFKAVSAWFSAQQGSAWHGQPSHIVDSVDFTQNGPSCALCSIAWSASRAMSVDAPTSQDAARQFILKHVEDTQSVGRVMDAKKPRLV